MNEQFKEWYYKEMIYCENLNDALNYAKALGISMMECIQLREDKGDKNVNS